MYNLLRDLVIFAPTHYVYKTMSKRQYRCFKAENPLVPFIMYFSLSSSQPQQYTHRFPKINRFINTLINQ